MTLEALIQSHAEALNANTKAVLLLEASLVGRSTKTGAEHRADVEKRETKKPDAKKEDLNVTQVISEEDKQAFADAKKAAEETASVPYETVRTLVLKLALTQRDAIKALNAKHGIANLKVLLDKEDDFSTVNDQAKLEAVYADLQALED